MSQWNRTFRVMLTMAAIAAAQSAAAVDAVTAPLPGSIGDRQVTIGPRTLKLPVGQWTLVGRAQGRIKSGAELSQTHYTVYAMDSRPAATPSGGPVVKLGVIARLPVNRAAVDTTKEEPCKHPDGLYTDLVHRQDFEAGRHCLLVFKHRSHLEGREGEKVVGQAAEWAAVTNLNRTGPIYEISYARYASDTFGWVRVVVPVTEFASQADAIKWAQTLPPALGDMLAHITTQAVLPALPGDSQ